MTADHRMRSDPIGRLLHVLCDVCAVIGGAVLIAMAAMTVVSVIGRTFFDSPILGDVELVQLGLAVCVATFLPLHAVSQRQHHRGLLHHGHQ